MKEVIPTSHSNQGLYIVNAWVAVNRLCIGQQKVEDKSNEITTLPLLIEEPDITEAAVSIDVIGCQRSIAEQITSKGGHHLLSSKEDQQELYDDAVCGFKACSAEDISEKWKYGHDWYETQKYSILKYLDALLSGNQQLLRHPLRFWRSNASAASRRCAPPLRGQRTTDGYAPLRVYGGFAPPQRRISAEAL